jgi:hypothetical protein
LTGALDSGDVCTIEHMQGRRGELRLAIHAICMIVHFACSVAGCAPGRLPVCTIEQMILRSGRMSSGADDLSWGCDKTNSQRLPMCPRALFIPSNKASQRCAWTRYSPCWDNWVWTLC